MREGKEGEGGRKEAKKGERKETKELEGEGERQAVIAKLQTRAYQGRARHWFTTSVVHI